MSKLPREEAEAAARAGATSVECDDGKTLGAFDVRFIDGEPWVRIAHVQALLKNVARRVPLLDDGASGRNVVQSIAVVLDVAERAGSGDV